MTLNRYKRPRRIDAGGAAARRREAAELKFENSRAAEDAQRQRIAKAAGRIPVLTSLDEVVEYASEIERLFPKGKILAFPALQLSSRLDSTKVFKALPQNYGNAPNVVAERTKQKSVGPHFDDYADNFRPWVLHENIKGSGVIRVAFMTKKLYSGYRNLADSLPNTDEADELLAQNRAVIGAIALQNTPESSIFLGDIKPGSRTLIWHGNNQHPPAVHDVVRDEPGDYRILAHQSVGDLGEGFVRIED